jgi:hypothetical protein
LKSCSCVTKPPASYEYLEAARPFARNDDLRMAIAELDLANWPASGVNLAQDDGCAPFCASRRPTRTRITAAPDLNGGRARIEVALEDRFFSITLARPMPATKLCSSLRLDKNAR